MKEDVKEGTPSKTAQEGLGDVLGSQSYQGTGVGEISLPSPVQELLALSGPGGSSLSQLELKKATPQTSAWRPDEVRKNRKLKAKAKYLKMKYRRKKKCGPKRRFKTHWQRKKRQQELNWKKYNLEICSTPWKKWKRSWQVNKVAVALTEEEFVEWIDALEGGSWNVKKIRVWDKVAKVDNFLAIDYEGKVLYRGTNVPESLKIG